MIKRVPTESCFSFAVHVDPTAAIAAGTNSTLEGMECHHHEGPSHRSDFLFSLAQSKQTVLEVGSGFLCFWDPRVARSCGRALSCPRRDRFPARSAAGLGSALLPHSFTKDNTTEIDRCFPAKVRRHTQTTTTRAATRQKQQQKDKEGNKRKRPFACCARSLLCSGSGTRRNKKRQSVLPSLLLSRDFEAGPSHLPSSSGRVSQLRGTMEDEPHEEAANDVVRCCYWDASRG